jgi:iron transport multicopper oxidase
VAIFVIMCVCALVPVRAGADVVRFHRDLTGSGWYPDQTDLSSVVVPGGTFGQLFSSTVNGQVYAQPLVADNTLLVATENDNAYGFDPVSGAQRWSANLGTPFNASDVGCSDLTPTIGITGTPVIDSATQTEYLFAKTYTAGVPAYWMHALDVATGAERSGFPVVITGTAANAPGYTFNAKMELQRPGLLLMDGVVYAAFAGHCDKSPYNGWVIGVSTSTHQITTRWVAQKTGADGAGIWQSGGALVSDGPGRIFLATGNGHDMMPGPTPGSSPPSDLPEAVVRLNVQPDGSLRPMDFFTPYDAPTLDVHDADFGSGGPITLPDAFGTPSHPHLILEEGKAGYVYMLDRDHLGGYRNGPNGGDDAFARLGSYGGVWNTPAVWTGGGGYIYMVHGPGSAARFGALRAYKAGVDGNGNPTLSYVARSGDAFGFGSGSPVITSNGTDPSSALVWVIWQPDGNGNGAQLRAYDAVPINGAMNLRWSAPIGQASKFEPPAVENNRVYVGTRDGHVLGFGSPIDRPLLASPNALAFPDTTVPQSSAQNLTLTATRGLTINSIASSNGMFHVGTPSPALPATLGNNGTVTVPVSFTPTARGSASGALTVSMSDGSKFAMAMEGVGRLVGGDMMVTPGELSLGGAAIGGAPIADTITFTNIGGTAVHVTGSSVPAPSTFFTVSGLPAVGTTIAPGASIVATVSFAPQQSGVFSGDVQLATDAPAPGTAVADVNVVATAAPSAHLVVQPDMYFGAVRLGSTVTRSVTIKNTGASAATITKSKPPALATGFTPLSALDEGTTIAPNQTVTLTVAFHATTAGQFTDTWVVNGDDDSGLHTITFHALASVAHNAYWMLDTSGRVYPFGDVTAMAATPLSLWRTAAIVATPDGGGYYVLDQIGRVQKTGNATVNGGLAPGALLAGERATTLSVTPSGGGFWIFTSRGRVFPFGDAVSFGDLSHKALNGPVIASIATPTGGGYYMIGSDGGVFTFGDAKFRGSMGGHHLNAPVVGIVPTATNAGYWLAASDGGVFTFGDATFRGSMGGRHLNAPVTGMVRYGSGYLMVATDGGIFDFSDVRFLGSLGGRILPAPIISVTAFAV